MYTPASVTKHYKGIIRIHEGRKDRKNSTDCTDVSLLVLSEVLIIEEELVLIRPSPRPHLPAPVMQIEDILWLHTMYFGDTSEFAYRFPAAFFTIGATTN